MDSRVETFAQEAEKRLTPLLRGRGFAGPEVERVDDLHTTVVRVVYRKGETIFESRLSLEYDEQEYVEMVLHSGDKLVHHLHSQLACQPVPDVTEMRHALDVQTAAVHETLNSAMQLAGP